MIIAIRKKAQEVSFVLIKVAGFIRRKELSGRVEAVAYAIIECLYAGDLNAATAKIDSAIGLASLASNVGDISPANFSILNRELENLRNAIAQLQSSQEVKEHPSIEGLFSKMIISPAREVSREASREIRRPVQIPPSDKSKNTNQATIGFSVSDQQDSDNAAKRQNDIMAKIRQSSNSKIQLKELIAAFPNISERTLRYDLLKLCQSGSLAREGTGGPSNHYVIPQSNNQSSVKSSIAVSITPAQISLPAPVTNSEIPRSI